MSTISTEERREVARRLRETGEELGSSALLWYYIAKILGVRTATDGKTACDMLADLIEPQPITGDTSDGHTPEQAISRIASLRPSCDRERLLDIAAVMAKDSIAAVKQGTSVNPPYILHQARYIAESCGETLSSLRVKDVQEFGTSSIPEEAAVDRRIRDALGEGES